MLLFTHISIHKKHFYRCFFGFVFCFATTSGFTQEIDSIQLKSVTVSAEKVSGIPAMKSVDIPAGILETLKTQNLGTVLTRNSGITIKNYGPSGIQTPTFRGMSASHTKIYMNGLDISPGSLGQSDLSIIPSFLLDKVSLKFGNTAFTEGPGAIGGGVMLTSDPQLPLLGSSFVAGISYGSFHSKVASFQYGYKTKKLQSLTRFILQDAQNNFEFRNIAQPGAPVQKLQHSEKNLNGVSQSIKYQVNTKNQLTGLFLGTFVNRNLPALMGDTKASVQSQKDALINAQLGWKHYGKKAISNLVGGYSWSALTYTDAAANINSTTINHRFQIREDFTLNLNANWALQTTGLIDYAIADNTNLSGNKDMLQTSILAGLNGHLAKKWESGIFIQPTINNGDFELLPMASIAFLPTQKKSLIIGFNVAQNVHFPTLNDLYWSPGGNPGLLPEKALNSELNIHIDGTMKKDMKWSLDGSTFYGNVDNWILWQPSDKGYWEAQNIKSVLHSGGEMGLGLKRNFSGISMSFRGSYQYISAINKGVNDASLDKQLIYTPKHAANWLIGAEYGQFWLNTNYTFTGKRYITSSNSSYLPAYDLINVSTGYDFKMSKNQELHFQVDVNNLLGKEYMSVAYRAMPGINFLVSLRYGFGAKPVRESDKKNQYSGSPKW